jgi:hypothetical protein
MMNRCLLAALLAAAATLGGCAADDNRQPSAEDRAARLDHIARTQRYDQAASPTKSSPSQNTNEVRSADVGANANNR